jgi:hypothetical protein
VAFTDALEGLCYALCGLYRTWLIMNQVDNRMHCLDRKARHTAVQLDTQLVSTWQCMGKVYNMGFMFGDPAQGVMLVCLNADRLIAVLFPLVSWHTNRAQPSRLSLTTSSLQRYYKYGRGYAVALIAPFYLYCLLLALLGVWSSYSAPEHLVYKQLCSISRTYNSRLYGAVSYLVSRA